MKKLLPALIVLIAVLGGGAGAMMTMTKKPKAHGEEAKVDVHHAEAPKQAGYFKFKRPFIVPVVSEEKITSLVMIDLSIEMDAGAAKDYLAREPKVRDGLMRALLGLSNEGYFTGDISNIETYDAVRDRLTEEAKLTLGDTVVSVLILDYARQER
ncbi:hypothetical protein [Parvularcula dongshanensis]|uniref:Flagellar basal body-associated protein FliL n=1 Tax=Parvularcula dongshanensis TaxID=1173995 RepID=A0A840I5T8_9PROT|nr:hypothetical protein [Parvularcula dongshanensis]MBB4659633.1 flagellar basal body-associated protein FliL [Parvularcula dongshanensis]